MRWSLSFDADDDVFKDDVVKNRSRGLSAAATIRRGPAQLNSPPLPHLCALVNLSASLRFLRNRLFSSGRRSGAGVTLWSALRAVRVDGGDAGHNGGRGCARRSRGGGNAQARGRRARQLGHLHPRDRRARRHLPQPRHRSAAPLYQRGRGDDAGGDLRQRRYRDRGGHRRGHGSVRQGRPGADHRRGRHRRQRPLLVRARRFADPLAQGCRRQDRRLFDQRRLDPRHAASRSSSISTSRRGRSRPAPPR